MSTTACATLYLKGSEIGDDETIHGRSITASRSQCVWYNINLRLLLGDLYDKFNTFNLCLTSISSGAPSESIGTNYLNSDIDNGHLSVYISGLPFINNTYSVYNRNNIAEAPIGVFTYPTATTQIGYRVYNDAGIVTFGKSQEQCSIQISLRRVYDDEEPDTVNFLPITNYMFTIVGVEPKGMNGSRI